MSKAKGTIYPSPRHQPFHVSRHPKTDENASADVLYVALDPLFVSQTAEALEVYPDRIELIEQQRETDPALVHVALALRAGIQARRGGDTMFGESLSTALAVHLLHDYSATAAKPQHAYLGLSKRN
jgi:AraC family transcriptional regulator